jgi:hypothetical protein
VLSGFDDHILDGERGASASFAAGEVNASGKRDFAIIGLGLQKIPTNSSQ